MATNEPPPLVTECPNCHTRFRVGESQLQIAHGRVRCGACLAVFAGVDHLLLDDSVPAPELAQESNMLESVLAELAEEGSEQGIGEQDLEVADLDAVTRELDALHLAAKEDAGRAAEDSGGTLGAPSAARAYELEALAARRGDTQELELSGGFLAAEEPASAAGDGDLELEAAEDADWTSVSVDTQELGPRVTLELARSGASSRFADAPEAAPPEAVNGAAKEPRATIEAALQDEDALRWWLEDELPVGDALADDDDAMVVQLSELDAVRDEDVELHELLGQPENGSKQQLEALFRELRDEEVGVADAASAAGNAEPEGAAASQQVVSEQREDAQTQEASGASATAGRDNAGTASERSVDELHRAIDQAEPLVTRAMTSSALAASANKVAAAERAAAAEQAALLAAQNPGFSAASANAKPAELLPEGQAFELVEPPAARRATQAQSPHARGLAPAAAEEKDAAAEEKDAAAEEKDAAAEEKDAAAAENDAAPENDTADEAGAVSEQGAAPDVGALAAGSVAVAAQSAAMKVSANLTQALEAVTPSPVSAPSEESPVKRIWQQAQAAAEPLLGNPYALRIGIVLALVLLVGQVMYSQFDDWAKSPTLRPVYGQICAVVGCELPVRRSLQDMQSRKLAVRSHPDKADALLVDALIINEAEFAQPFPVIELQFMDINQQIVGSYELNPDDYLDGELAGSSALMAVRTPVHIDIEIADPGPTAVNYQLQFR